jgi:hypothetical protein
MDALWACRSLAGLAATKPSSIWPANCRGTAAWQRELRPDRSAAGGTNCGFLLLNSAGQPRAASVDFACLINFTIRVGLRGARPTSAAIDQIRTRDQPSKGASARHRGAARDNLHRGRGDRIERTMSAFGPKRTSASITSMDEDPLFR